MLFAAGTAHGGCGCDKPPPLPAAVRPTFASPGGTVTLFVPALLDGLLYEVEFRRGTQTTVVEGVAETIRDYADALLRPQLAVVAPELTPGPARIVVRLGPITLLDVPESDFTILPPPVAVPAGNAIVKVTDYRAAVGADGTMYLPLDLSAITARTVFTGLGKNGFRFIFDADDVTIYNVQGVVMEALATSSAPHVIDDGNADPSNEPDEQGAASSRLIYDRHEFETYRLSHLTDPQRLLDTADLGWHLDGSRHIDHDHLVLAFAGQLNANQTLSPGTTQPFTLKISTSVPDDRTAPTMVARIAWSGGSTSTSTSTTSTSTTEPPPGVTTTSIPEPDGVCTFPGAGVLLACLCDDETLAVCEGEALPRSVIEPIRKACRLLARSVEEQGDVVAYLRGRAALRLERAREALGRRRTGRLLSRRCRTALETAVAFELP